MYKQTALSFHNTLRLCLNLVAEEHWRMDNFLPFQGISPPKIRVYHPKSFEDAEEAINMMKTDDMLLVNLVALESRLAQRLDRLLSWKYLCVIRRVYRDWQKCFPIRTTIILDHKNDGFCLSFWHIKHYRFIWSSFETSESLL